MKGLATINLVGSQTIRPAESCRQLLLLETKVDLLTATIHLISNLLLRSVNRLLSKEHLLVLIYSIGHDQVLLLLTILDKWLLVHQLLRLSSEMTIRHRMILVSIHILVEILLLLVGLPWRSHVEIDTHWLALINQSAMCLDHYRLTISHLWLRLIYNPVLIYLLNFHLPVNCVIAFSVPLTLRKSLVTTRPGPILDDHDLLVSERIVVQNWSRYILGISQRGLFLATCFSAVLLPDHFHFFLRGDKCRLSVVFTAAGEDTLA